MIASIASFPVSPGSVAPWEPNASDSSSIAAPTAMPRTDALVPVLFVEDDETIRDICVLILRRAGYSVEAANDGEAAWAALRARRFQLVVTDDRMPMLTGVDLALRLRRDGSSLPVILASGSLPWDEDQIPVELLPMTLLPKPYNGSDLLAKVRESLAATTERNQPSGSPSAR